MAKKDASKAKAAVEQERLDIAMDASTQIVDLLTAALQHEELHNPHVVALVARSRDLADQITDALDPRSDASTEDVHRAVFHAL